MCDKGLDQFSQTRVIGGFDIMGIDAAQLSKVKTRRRFTNTIQIKPFDGLFG